MAKSLLILLSFTFLLFACSQESDLKTNNVLLLKEGTDKQLHFSVENLSTLKGFSPLSGKAANIHWHGYYSGSLHKDKEAQVKVLKSSKGYYYPTTIKGMYSLSMYSAFESMYKTEKDLGVANHLSWPREVSLNLFDKRESDNAFYDPSNNTTVFLPASSKFPVFLNRGIIAHEHFHSYFRVLIPIPEVERTSANNQDFSSCSHQGVEVESDRDEGRYSKYTYKDLVQRGWNEGLADFWGFLYSDDPKFIARSIKLSPFYRALDNNFCNNLNFEQLESVINRIEATSHLITRNRNTFLCPISSKQGLFYALGSMVASKLYRLFEADTRPRAEKKASFMKAVISVLSQQNNSQNFITDTVDPDKVVQLIELKLREER